MPVIGGQNPTATVTVPVPTPAPMKKPRPAPQPTPQPVPANPDSQQQDVPQGMVPPVPQQPEPRSIILPWAPPPSGTPRSAMRKMRMKYARGDEIAAMVRSVHENHADSLPRNALADYLSENHEAHYTPKEIQALRTIPHLKIEHIPDNPHRPVHIAKLTMADIRAAHRAGGGHWFDRGNNQFFGTKYVGGVHHGPGGVYFMTSEPVYLQTSTANRRYTIRQFHPETGAVRTANTVYGQHGDVETARNEIRNRAAGTHQEPEQLQRKYSADDDGLSMDFDSMGEDELPKMPLQRPAPKEDITGRTRKQILQQMLEAARKGHYDPSGMTPRDYIQDIENKDDVPQGGGDVFMSDPEDELPEKMSRIGYPRHMARSSPEDTEALFKATQASPDDHVLRNALADTLADNGHPKSVIEHLRSGLPVWVGKSPKGVINAIPFASKQAMSATDSWGRPRYGSMYHATSRNRKGQAHGVRVSGKMQTWKTRPDEFRIPWKFGLYDNGELNHRNFREWLLDDPTQEPT